MMWVVSKRDRLERPYCAVNSLWVDPELRRRGLVTLLTGACQAWMVDRGLSRIEASTHFTNSRMREILEDLGFVPGHVMYSRTIEQAVGAIGPARP
jgi:ribosomal protein S18 acetylase RimI-like enzyme